MQVYRAELHVHTVLSPCAEVEMIPPLIVREALERGITIVAITDHNASANVSAVQRAAYGSGLTVLPGMELQTKEEVHVLCLFDSLEALADWQSQVDRALPPTENNIEYFGEQFVVDEVGEFIRRETQLLLTSASISIEEAFTGVTTRGGLAIPAHVNRKAFGLFANLGFIPTDLEVEALEISRHIMPANALTIYPELDAYPLVQGGDAHRLDEILGANEFTLEAPTIAEIRKAFHSAVGRSHHLRSM